jgi:hypothetical protein
MIIIIKSLNKITLKCLILHDAKVFHEYNEPDGIKNATHNTFAKLTWIFTYLLI